METTVGAIRRWTTVGYQVVILVFGKTGQVASELQKFDDVITLGREDVDLADPAACTAAICKHAPEAVINAAAYTAVDRAEDEEHLATVINGDAPTAMAKACAERGIPWFIFQPIMFLTEREKSRGVLRMTEPQNAYGRSKLAGEHGICNSGAVYVILRTSWVVSAHGVNFVKTMLRLSETRDALGVVADQIGGPTPARDIAKACLQIANQLIQEPAKSGTYHFSGAPDVSWAEFAEEVFSIADRLITLFPSQRLTIRHLLNAL